MLPLLQVLPEQHSWLVLPQLAQVTPLHTVPLQQAGLPVPQDWPLALQVLLEPVQTPLEQVSGDWQRVPLWQQG